MIDVIIECRGWIDQELDVIAKKIGGLKDIGAGTHLQSGIRDYQFQTKDESKARKFAQEIARKWDGVRVQVRGVIFEKGNTRGRAREKDHAPNK